MMAVAVPLRPLADDLEERTSCLYRARSLTELNADPALTLPPRFVIPNLVERGCVTLFSAKAKTGKSTIASQLAADLTAGRVALDGAPMEAGRVLWVAVDEALRRLVQRMPSYAADPDRFFVVARE
jgi:hypothetical protein